MECKLISITPDAEKTIAYLARVSSSHQDNPEIAKLLSYCIKHSHWSVFEMADMIVEIKTSRAIAAQILRHKSFSFQEFSLRYAQVNNFELYEPRRQDVKNRQNSIDDLPAKDEDWFLNALIGVNTTAHSLYKEALSRGIAKESARFLLPLTTSTKLYMKGNLRSWITYLMVRLDPTTQLEHKEIAQACWGLFQEQFPVISEALKNHKPEIFK
jgi:thymidylate synthase (FAD)